jgi:hypothetical protein
LRPVLAGPSSSAPTSCKRSRWSPRPRSRTSWSVTSSSAHRLNPVGSIPAIWSAAVLEGAGRRDPPAARIRARHVGAQALDAHEPSERPVLLFACRVRRLGRIDAAQHPKTQWGRSGSIRGAGCAGSLPRAGRSERRAAAYFTRSARSSGGRRRRVGRQPAAVTT